MSPERISAITIERPQNLDTHFNGGVIGPPIITSIEKPKNLEIDDRNELVRNLLADLKIEEENYFGRLSSLIPDGASEAGVRSLINHRYEELCGLRARTGIYEKPAVFGELAIALLDPELFGQVKKAIEEKGEIIRTARHETGHAVVAARLGWSVEEVTVVPGSDYLGLTIAVPTKNLSFADWLLESAAISYGGALAAKKSGDAVRGTGADMASCQVKARIAVDLGMYSSEQAFLSAAQNLANGIVGGFGPASINHQALTLAEKQTIV